MIEKDKLNLIQYIKTEQAKGVPRTQIEETLIAQGGWTRDDLLQVFSSTDIVSQSGNNQTLSAKQNVKSGNGRYKIWYLLFLFPLFMGVFMNEAFSSYGRMIFIQDPNAGIKGLVLIGFIFLFINFFLVRAIVKSAKNQNKGGIVLNIFIIIIFNIGLWGTQAILFSCFDCGTTENFKPSSLPNIVTTTNENFILQQGQLAEITDISATFRYTGFFSGGEGGDSASYDFSYKDSRGPAFNEYNVIQIRDYFTNDHSMMTFRVETPETTCENSDSSYKDGCWGGLAERKRDVKYCLIMADTARRSSCISRVVYLVFNWQNPEPAREMCKSDTSLDFNYCKVIGVDQFMSLKTCIDTYNNLGLIGFNQPLALCMSIAKSTKTGKPEDCQALPESDNKEICKNMFDPSSPHYYE